MDKDLESMAIRRNQPGHWVGEKNPSYKHGESHTSRLYGIWTSMKKRCHKSYDPSYARYGARGIRVCDEWFDDYIAFRDWALANGYKDGLTIDRIDVNGNYEPDNCRWATNREQCNNRRNNVRLEYNGETHTMAEWSRILNVPVATIKARKRKGWSTEEILFHNGNKCHVNQNC